jgi:uncharacterized RDD family membrane protein YckC
MKIKGNTRPRINAFLIDLMMIKVIYYASIFSALLFMTDLNINWRYQDFVNIKSNSLASLYLIFTMYFSLSLYLGNGKTLGKLVMGLKVYSMEGSKELSFKESFLRSLGYGFSVLCFLLPFAFIFFNKQKKTFACILSNTYSRPEEIKRSFEVVEYFEEYKKVS